MFKFYLKPYLLSLSFEQSLKPSEEPAKAVYNHDKHILTVYLEKLTNKEYFQNLNLLSNILQNKKGDKKEQKK
jgi:protein SHQ1